MARNREPEMEAASWTGSSSSWWYRCRTWTRAKAFYLEQAQFDLLVDHRAGADFRVVQVTPRGSACSIALMRNAASAGTVQGLQRVVSDINVARAQLAENGTDVSEIFHFEDGGQVPGPDPHRSDYGSFLSLSDPVGSGWLVQEVGRSMPEA